MELQKAVAIAGEKPIDWLGAIVLSWLIPIGLVPWVPATYLSSLSLWLVPIVLLLPRFFQKTDRGGRRRRAMLWSVTYIAVAGAVLDFFFGSIILKFDHMEKYLFPIPAFGGKIPVEEILFYILGGVAIIIVYCWADEYWLESYTVRRRREAVPDGGRLIFLSTQAVVVGSILWIAGVALASSQKGRFTVPLYYTFIVAVAFVPAMALFHNVKPFVNWRAFSLTCLWVLLTSCLWEATLALKRSWWGYQDDAMLGINISDWSTPFSHYPIEALLVWIVVTFTSVLTFEAVKFYQYDPRPGMKRRILG